MGAVVGLSTWVNDQMKNRKGFGVELSMDLTLLLSIVE
jgi:hypothetical protein